MNWREKMPPAFVRMFSIYHADIPFERPSLDELAEMAAAQLRPDERSIVADFLTKLLAAGLTRGELRTVWRKTPAEFYVSDPRPLFELIRDRLNKPEKTKSERKVVSRRHGI